MSTTTKKASARCGNTGTLEAQNPPINQGKSGTTNDSTSIPVYKMLNEPYFHLLPVEAGANSRRIIEQATRVLRTLDASGIPKPMCVDFTDGETTVLCGKQFCIEKYLDIKFAANLRAAMEAAGVNYVSVMSVGEPHMPTISFGRNGKPEFLAYICMGR